MLIMAVDVGPSSSRAHCFGASGTGVPGILPAATEPQQRPYDNFVGSRFS